jgi:hypothetical protein
VRGRRGTTGCCSRSGTGCGCSSPSVRAGGCGYGHGTARASPPGSVRCSPRSLTCPQGLGSTASWWRSPSAPAVRCRTSPPSGAPSLAAPRRPLRSWFVAFDLLELAGEDLRQQSWRDRDQQRREALPASERIRLVRSLPVSPATHDEIVGLGFEGSVLKRRSASATGTTATAGSATPRSCCGPCIRSGSIGRPTTSSYFIADVAGGDDDLLVLYGVGGEPELREEVLERRPQALHLLEDLLLGGVRSGRPTGRVARGVGVRQALARRGGRDPSRRVRPRRRRARGVRPAQRDPGARRRTAADPTAPVPPTRRRARPQHGVRDRR